MTAPGLVRVWNGRDAVVEAFPIKSGYVIGRDRFSGDDKMSAQHAQIDIAGALFVVTDMTSRNGTYVNGQREAVARDVAAPAVICAGRSVFVLVGDVTPFGGARIETHGELDVGAGLAAAWRTIEEAATAEDNVLITGPAGSPRAQLAEAYVERRGGGSITYSPVSSTRPLDAVLVPPIGTVIIEHANQLTSRDHATLEQWLETDVRFVTIGLPGVERRVPVALRDRLLARMIEVPPIARRPEELVALIRRSADPKIELHYSGIDACLRRRWWGDADEVVAAVGDACQSVERRNGSKLRADDLRPEREPTRVTFAAYFERVMGTPPPFEVPEDYAPMIVSDGREQMITSSAREPAILVQMQTGEIERKERGWFQYGFWGHGVNSYALYFGEVTDRHRVFFRVPYGAGVYASDPDDERRRALALLETYRVFRALPTVKRATIVQSIGSGRYEIEMEDGRVLRNDDVHSVTGDLALLIR